MCCCHVAPGWFTLNREKANDKTSSYEKVTAARKVRLTPLSFTAPQAKRPVFHSSSLYSYALPLHASPPCILNSTVARGPSRLAMPHPRRPTHRLTDTNAPAVRVPHPPAGWPPLPAPSPGLAVASEDTEEGESESVDGGEGEGGEKLKPSSAPFLHSGETASGMTSAT